MATYRDRPLSFGDALRVAREILGASPELVAKGSIEAEAEQLVLAANRASEGRLLSRIELFTRLRDRYPDAAGDKLLVLAGSRAEGKPLQHLTGVQVFLEHEYEVGPEVLVPRPETEVLVVHAIESLRGDLAPAQRRSFTGLEIGVGSGAISIELLSALPGLRMIASELTDAARARARSNARRILGPERAGALEIVQASDALEVWGPFERSTLGQGRADFLVSNPPYLSARDPIEADVVAHEPATALFAPAADPLHFYRQIALHARRFLKPGAKAFLEVAFERAAATRDLFVESGWAESVLVPDLTGRDRVLVASSPIKG